MVERDFAQEMAAARSGGPRGLDTLFARHLPPLIAFIRAQSGQAVMARESAADLAQSVCREVLEDAPKIQLKDEGAFRNWLFMAASRKVLDRARFLGRERRDIAREVPIPDSLSEADALMASVASQLTPSVFASALELKDRFESAIQLLPKDQRDAVTMARLLELSYAQIAERMDRSESSVRSLVHRGLAQVADRLCTTD